MEKNVNQVVFIHHGSGDVPSTLGINEERRHAIEVLASQAVFDNCKTHSESLEKMIEGLNPNETFMCALIYATLRTNLEVAKALCETLSELPDEITLSAIKPKVFSDYKNLVLTIKNSK